MYPGDRIQGWSYLLFFQVNPFSDRMCDIFSSSLNGDLSFEDFLEMMSAFSEKANRNVKVDYAFKIYGESSSLRANFDFLSEDLLTYSRLQDLSCLSYNVSWSSFWEEKLSIVWLFLHSFSTVIKHILKLYISDQSDGHVVVPLLEGSDVDIMCSVRMLNRCKYHPNLRLILSEILFYLVFVFLFIF